MSLLSPDVTLYDFCTSEKLFKSFNPKGESWLGWNTMFKVFSGLDLEKKEQKFFHKVTGGLSYRKGKMPTNFLGLIGRGGGKSLNIGRIAQYRTLVFDKPLAPGQWAQSLVISPNFRTGNIPLEFVEGLFDENPRLKKFVTGHKKTEQIAELRLQNRCKIALSPITRVSGRGPATWTLIMEEAAHFKTEGRFSDEEVFKSARPSMNRFAGSAFFIITTPYVKEGLVWKLYKDYFGKQNDVVLVVQGDYKLFNPMADETPYLQDLEMFGEDHVHREYGAEWIDSINAAFDGEAVEDCILNGQHELPCNPDVEHFGIIDVAGLSENSIYNDEYAIAIAHIEEREGEPMVVVDLVRGFSANKDSHKKYTPELADNETIEVFKAYGVSDVFGDKYNVERVKGIFENAGFNYHQTKLHKYDLYRELMPIINNRQIRFIDDEKASAQLKTLERKPGRSGKDIIDHPKGKHDDRANVIAVAAYEGAQRAASAGVSVVWV